jgi:drug/metabolite transporter (DMT)-like permease
VPRKRFVPLTRKQLPYFALLGLLGICLHLLLQSNGLLTSDATTTAWIVVTTPVFIALLGWLVLRENLDRVLAFGIALAPTGKQSKPKQKKTLEAIQMDYR